MEKGYKREKTLLEYPIAVISLLVICLLVFCAIFASWIAPYDPLVSGNDYLTAPCRQYLLGTDQLGRDIFSRLVYGARISLVAGFVTTLLSVVIGTFVGLISGYFGKSVDTVLMRMTDVVMSFPDLMLVLVIISILGSNLTNIIFVLGFLGWPSLARLVRGNVLAIKELDYVASCQVLGYSAWRIMFGHILPNLKHVIFVTATFGVARNILLESSLSFLGVGIPLPIPSWGNMLSDVKSLVMLAKYPWLWVAPGLAILTCVLAVNFLGNVLLDMTDTKNLYL